MEVKINLRSSVIIWDINSYCFRSYYLSYNIFAKIQIQDLLIKKSKFKKFKLKKSKLANKKSSILLYINKLAKSNYQNKKKKYFKKSKTIKTLT